MVFTRIVSSRIETTLAACHATGFGTLVTVVPLFAPRIAVAVVSIHLPESRLVVLHETQAAYPLRGLPEIQMRYEEARGPSVFRVERFAIVLPDDQPFSVEQILHRQVG